MVHLYKKNNKLACDIPFELKEIVKSLGGRWSPKDKLWTLDYTVSNYKSITDIAINYTATSEVINDLYIDSEEKNYIRKINYDTVPKPLIKSPFDLLKLQKQYYADCIDLLYNKHKKAYGFLFEQGCGKTITTIAVLSRLFIDKKINRVLIIAPLSVIFEWKRNFDKFADFNFNITEIIGATKKKKLNLLDTEVNFDTLQIDCINYESTWRDGIKEKLESNNYDVIVCDESQHIKSHNSTQSKFIYNLGKLVKYKFILTGTPISNGPVDVFGQYRFLNDTLFGKSFYQFKNLYCFMGGFENRQIIGYKNKEQLKKYMYVQAGRMLKEQAADLPERIDQFLYADLEPKVQKLYNTVKHDCFVAIQNGEKQGKMSISQKITQILRLSQISGGFLTYDLAKNGKPVLDSKGKALKETKQISNSKINVLKDYLKFNVSNQSIVIYARFKAECDLIEEEVKKLKFSYAKIVGDTNGELRSQIVKDFQDKKTQILILNLKINEGMTLTAADTMIFYNFNYSFSDYDQAKARIHRIGQKNNCNYIHIIAKNTIDETVIKVLQNKGNLADEFTKILQ